MVSTGDAANVRTPYRPKGWGIDDPEGAIVTVTDRRDVKEPRTVLDRVEAMAPSIADRAAEIEAARRLPPDLLADLTAAGCFRVFLPTSHGGFGADLATTMQMFETLSRADASVGWTVGIGSSGWIDLVGLPRATFDALYAGGADVVTAGVINPSGTVTAEPGGFRVQGQWAFASGCEHATWLYANSVEAGDGEPRLRIVLLTPDEVEILDTWHVSGLRGTGSHDFRVDDVLVPADRTFLLLEAEPCVDVPAVRIPPPQLFALALSSVAMGIAQGALDDVLAIASGKVPLFETTSVAANPLFQHQLATSDTELRAARALLYEHADEAWAMASDRSEFTLEQRARIRAAGVWATERAHAIVERAYRAGGGASLYDASPLQRRLRDINAVAQHFLVKPDTLTTAGAILAGQDVDLIVF
jgi:indole-3-acetate monooxygenase